MKARFGKSGFAARLCERAASFRAGRQTFVSILLDETLDGTAKLFNPAWRPSRRFGAFFPHTLLHRGMVWELQISAAAVGPTLKARPPRAHRRVPCAER